MSVAMQQVSRDTFHEKMVEEWGSVIKEFLSKRPMYVQSRHIGPDFFRENPMFFQTASHMGKKVHLGVLLGGVGCTVYSQGRTHGYVWRNPYSE